MPSMMMRTPLTCPLWRIKEGLALWTFTLFSSLYGLAFCVCC